MLTVGLDVHWRRSTFCVLDANGKRLETRTVRGRWSKVLEELKKVKDRLGGRGERMQVCFEASCGAGYLQDQLRAFPARVVPAHPGHLRLIFRSKRKSDRVDARKLATLLYLDQVPTAYLPEPEVRAWRGTIEFRHRLIGKRTRVKNSLRSLLRSLGVEAPRGLWTRAGRAWLDALELQDELHALQLDLLLEELETLAAKIRRVERELNRRARADAGVRLLMTIPGVGVRTGEAVRAYVDRPNRFRHNRTIGAYFGLVPCQDESAGKNRLGHITKQGAGTVRKLLVEATWIAVRHSPTMRALCERIQHGDPGRKKIAVVAAAHHLARAMLAMLNTGETWREAV
jgi:transposase